MNLNFIRNLAAIFGIGGRSRSWFTNKTIRRRYPKRGRNEPCWCRSGKKYKYCHFREDYLAGLV